MLLIVGAWGICGTWAGFRTLSTQFGVAHYEPVAATVDWSRVDEEERRGSKGRRYTAYLFRVEYSYSVNGQDYAGSRFDTQGRIDLGRTRAHKLASQYAAGRRVTAYYDPSDPSASLLDRTVYAHHAVILLTSLPAAGFALMLLGDFILDLFPSLRRLPHGGVPVRTVGPLIHVRLPVTGPRRFAAHFALGTALLVGLAMLVIDTWAGVDVPIALAVGLYALMLPVGILAGWWRLTALRGGSDDLTIDAHARTIRFARWWGSGFGEESIDRVVAIRTGYRMGGKRNESRMGTFVEIDFDHRGAERLVEWYEDRRADEFGRWLADVLTKVRIQER